ncbi:uncharacterized protein LOC130914705 [Corythoichthys intestinalis]|uniref:uncharacterized protein LOC130914705 n=1 Tax=Corythoichthys intestinalis TaxID=161448 RepID=UPI0025A5D9A0|nr:uncharacterized protein LOC130914705 [Corythoichthys intestinalis]
MGVLSFMRAHFNADVDIAIEELLHMQPTSLSEREVYMYNIEKTYMRQFMLLEKENEVPSHLSAENMKQWLLNKRSFQHEFGSFEMKVHPGMFELLRVAWTRARIMCLNQMHWQVCKDFTLEERLSRLFNRKVTIEGLQKYLSIVAPLAEGNIKTYVHHLYRSLQVSLSSSEMTETQRLTLYPDFHRATAPIVREILRLVLNSLMLKLDCLGNDEPITATLEQRSERASKKIVRMLTDALLSIPCLRQHITQDNVLDICTYTAGKITQNLFCNILQSAANVHFLSCDETLLTARLEVKNAIVEMVDNGSDLPLLS